MPRLARSSCNKSWWRKIVPECRRKLRTKCTWLEKRAWQMLVSIGENHLYIFLLFFLLSSYAIMKFLSILRLMKEAEANKLKLTPQYLELRFIEAIANNSKIFFGNKVLSLSLYIYIHIYTYTHTHIHIYICINHLGVEERPMGSVVLWFKCPWTP